MPRSNKIKPLAPAIALVGLRNRGAKGTSIINGRAWAPLIFFLCVVSGGVARTADGGSLNTQEDEDADVSPIDSLRDAREQLDASIKTAFVRGRVMQELQEGGALSPVVLQDSDIQIIYNHPRFRVHLVHAKRLSEAVRPVGKSDQEFERWVPSPVSEQIILFDGRQIFTIQKDSDGECRGEIYFGFAKMTVMRTAGFPFEDPIRLWIPALDLESLSREKLDWTQLDGGGKIGLLRKSTYRMRFFVFNKFSYDLRRVSSYRIGESQPFRDYLLSWEQSNGVHYVQRYTNTVASAHGDTGSSAQTLRRLKVEFERVDPNVAVSEEVFSVGAFDIPDGTVFRDKRASVQGGPKELVFLGGELIEQQAQEK